MKAHFGGERTCAEKAFATAPLQRQDTLKVKPFWPGVPAASAASPWRSSSCDFSLLVRNPPCSSVSSSTCFSSWHSLFSCVFCICSAFNFLVIMVSFSPSFLFCWKFKMPVRCPSQFHEKLSLGGSPGAPHQLSCVSPPPTARDDYLHHGGSINKG